MKQLVTIPRIVIAESDFFFIRAYHDDLEAKGFEVVVCNSAADTESCLRDEGKDAKLIAINARLTVDAKPGYESREGIELYRRIRKTRKTTPILLYSFPEIQEALEPDNHRTVVSINTCRRKDFCTLAEGLAKAQ